MPAIAAAVLWGASAIVGSGLYLDSTSMADGPDAAGELALVGAPGSFRVIMTRNLWVLSINVAGVASLGISTIGSVVANGLQAGMVLAQAYREGLDPRSFVAVTLPHGIELVALWLAAAVGFLGPRLTLSLVRNGRLPAAPRPETLALVALGLAGLIIVAAALEAAISLPMAERLRSAAFEIGT
ncbi:MAG TPA: stage II sporulation protein M [Acidobacteriota bacterium]|nr:stage II sporulation protein M [Acidobacteriota bacterium]